MLRRAVTVPFLEKRETISADQERIDREGIDERA